MTDKETFDEERSAGPADIYTSPSPSLGHLANQLLVVFSSIHQFYKAGRAANSCADHVINISINDQ